MNSTLLFKPNAHSRVKPPRFLDCYDRAVAILTRHPKLISRAWSVPSAGFLFGAPIGFAIRDQREQVLTNYCHCLFGYVTHNRKATPGCGHGCLTQVHNTIIEQFAATDTLTTAIRADTRLPGLNREITPDHLPIFAGWQRRIDIALNREPLPI